MQLSEYEKYLTDGLSVECGGCSVYIMKDNYYTWRNGNLYCDECEDCEDEW